MFATFLAFVLFFNNNFNLKKAICRQRFGKKPNTFYFDQIHEYLTRSQEQKDTIYQGDNILHLGGSKQNCRWQEGDFGVSWIYSEFKWGLGIGYSSQVVREKSPFRREWDSRITHYVIAVPFKNPLMAHFFFLIALLSGNVLLF